MVKGGEFKFSLLTKILISLLILFLIIIIVAYYIKWNSGDITGNVVGISGFFNSIFGSPNAAPKGPTSPAQCNDHLDNDGDGFCDFKAGRAYCSDGSILGDPGCSDKNDNSEVGTSCVPSTEICDGIDNDCDNQIDENNVCIPSTCTNGVKDGSETDIDCGGSCSLCIIGKTCSVNLDCLSNYCYNSVCSEAPYQLDPSCMPLKYAGGSPSGEINIVFVPSNFSGNMTLFQQKAEWIFSVFNNYPPFNNSIQKLNAFYVPVESGDYCYFNCNGIARLLCCDTSKATSLSSKCTSGSRQTVVIENSATYGGAGYVGSDVATTSTHSSSPQVAIHELGHSLFNLGDEYDASSGPSYPNCDYAGCNKWKDMIGYKGVNCAASSCQGLAYYASESTIMRSLSYNFQEVNLRLSCCIYYQETGSFPEYCNEFNQLNISLNQFCGVSGGSGGTGSVPLIQPYEYSFVKENGVWILEGITPKMPGNYESEKVNGNSKGNSSLVLVTRNKKLRTLLFDEEVDVEYPLSEVNLGGYVKQKGSRFSIIVDHSKEDVNEIVINGKKIYKKNDI